MDFQAFWNDNYIGGIFFPASFIEYLKEIFVGFIEYPEEIFPVKEIR